MRPGFVVRKGRTRAYFKGFRRSLFQNPGRHLGRSDNNTGLVISMPPRVIIVYSWIYGNNTFSTIMPCWAESGGLFGAPRNAGKTSRAFLEPPHAVVGAPRADGAVYARSLCLPRLEGARIAQREISVPSTRTISPGRARLDVVVHTYIMSVRQVVVVVLK